ncbi:MAG: hypothetical protein EB828_03735 [Nitrosopumilus sp. D6]|nr:MAG: hypothetical protein EB828_03735 [Nitrosopumilus sp. D6]
MAQEEKISRIWWILPIFLTLVGGLICYFALRDRNEKKARNMLYLGIALLVPHLIMLYLGSANMPPPS